jgi:hypothetical protein
MAILSLFYGYVDKQGSSAVCVSVWRTSANACSPLAWAKGVSMRKLLSFLFFAAVPMILLAVSPGQVWAQSGTVTDDAFISTSSTTQLVNFNGQGIALVVAGSTAYSSVPCVSWHNFGAIRKRSRGRFCYPQPVD